MLLAGVRGGQERASHRSRAAATGGTPQTRSASVARGKRAASAPPCDPLDGHPLDGPPLDGDPFDWVPDVERP